MLRLHYVSIHFWRKSVSYFSHIERQCKVLLMFWFGFKGVWKYCVCVTQYPVSWLKQLTPPNSKKLFINMQAKVTRFNLWNFLTIKWCLNFQKWGTDKSYSHFRDVLGRLISHIFKQQEKKENSWNLYIFHGLTIKWGELFYIWNKDKFGGFSFSQ